MPEQNLTYNNEIVNSQYFVFEYLILFSSENKPSTALLHQIKRNTY